MIIKTKIQDSLWSILFLFVFAGSALNAMAYDFKVDGIYYNYGDTEFTVSVTSGLPKCSGDVVIPATVEYNGVTYTVTAIEDYALDLSPDLTSVTIPATVTRIGKLALTGSPNLGSIVVDSVNQVFDSRDNCNAVIETATNTLLFGCKNTVIPNTVTAIGYSAFDSADNTEFNIPSSVVTIADRAFAYCAKMTSISIGCSVASIGFRIFEGSNNLTEIVVDGNNQTFDCRNNCNAIIETATNKLVAGCKSTIIPDDVTIIGDYAFKSCQNLSSITIPNSVAIIGNHAFDDCYYYLTSIELPNSVRSIGEYAFKNCKALKTITIPKSVAIIGDYAFDLCNLESVTCLATIPPFAGANSFYTYNTTTLYVPSYLVNTYQTADVWKKFITIIGIDLPSENYDVNGDGQVTIADVTNLIDYLLSH